MTSNGFSTDDYDLTPSSMKYRTLDEDVESTRTQQPQAPQKTSEEKFKGTPCTLKEWIFLILIVILLVFIMAFGISTIKNTQAGGSSSAQSGFNQNLPKSCNDAIKQGITNSGIISIQPDTSMSPFEVYCDMSAVGGGWTMIASIHEDDISQRCGPGDMWSSSTRSSSSAPPFYRDYSFYGPSRNYAYNPGGFLPEGFQHWKNLITFGDPSGATSADYKSKAYYAVPGSNMMIWHVPNNVMMSRISDEAFFKYYTDTNFLLKYGSTLQTLYSRYAPLKRLSPEGIQKEFLPCFKTDWAFYNDTGSSSSRRTPPSRRPPNSRSTSSLTTTSFPPTTSSKVNSQIQNDEFYISVNRGPNIRVQSGKVNNVSKQINVSFSDQSPTVMLAWVGNEDSSIKTILFTVKRKYGAKSKSRYAYYASTRDFSLQFQYVCSSVKCSVFFILTSTKLWDSRTPGNRFNSTQPFWGTINITSPNQRFMFGHADFARQPVGVPNSRIVREMLRKLMNCFSKTEQFQLNKFPSISTEARFIKGKMIDNIKNVTPGYIEMRKYDSLGYPFALCPGIRVNGSDPAMHCVGSVQTHYSLRNKCGDFAAWDQLIEHNKQRNQTGATDITSSLLLFVR